MRIILIFIFGIISIHTSVGQLTDDMKETEEMLRASNKQMNQFFRRFNGEEDEKGNRLYSKDKKFRDPSLRKKYLPRLFDLQTSKIDSDVAKGFIRTVSDKKAPLFLDHHKDDWFAEVSTTFSYKGREISGLLYMRMQRQGQGYEWVIEDVAFDEFQKYFDKDTSTTKKFMHPLSHELDFMTLRKALQKTDHSEQFTGRSFKPDFLSIFLYEINQGNLEFKNVKNTEFHFFAINGYYFSLANYNRSGYNSGWLISNLVLLNGSSQKKQMKDYIYNKN